MERVAAFVDAGYFWVQIAHLLYGWRERREKIVLDARLMRESLLRQIREQFPGCSLLRIYWYDGRDPNGQITPQNREIACLNDIKIRYGTLNGEGQQKGVDGLLMADMIALAQNRAITSALLISGDADLTPGVSAVQMLGVRVHRLEMANQVASSPVLSEEVDVNTEWPAGEIESFISRKAPDGEKTGTEPSGTSRTPLSGQPEGAHPAGTGPNGATLPAKDTVSPEEQPESAARPSLQEIARAFVAELEDGEKDTLKRSIAIPKEYDKRLLFMAKTKLGRYLEAEEKRKLREYVKGCL